MCLSIPAKLIAKEGDQGKADVEGNIVEVNLSLLTDVQIGDYVLVHTGFAIQKYNEDEALRTLELIREMFDAGT